MTSETSDAPAKNGRSLATFQARACCPRCGQQERRMHVPLPYIPVVRCVSCAFMFSELVMAEDRLERFYAESYGGHRHRQGQMVNACVNMQALQRLVRLDRGSLVLDVGSGYGYLLRAMRDRLGVVPTGVELSKDEADYARRINGIDTYEVPLAQAPLQPESFDLVASFETIEHVPNPSDFVRSLCRYVKPGGALLIMTDNFESAVARRMGPHFPKWIPHQHICHFSDESLPALIEETTSLRIECTLSYTPWELMASAAFASITRTGRPATFDLDRELHSEMARGYRLYWLRRTLNQLWARYTFRKDLRGALMYVLARKPDGGLTPLAAS